MNTQPLSIFTSAAGAAISWFYRRLRGSEAESELQDPNSTNSNNNVEVAIKSMERLLQCLKNQTSFRFDPSFSILDLTYSSIDSYKPIIKALNDDHSVRKIIVNKVLDAQDFVTCLTKHNTTVTTISLHAYCFDIDATEAIVQILKANPLIKVLELTQQAANISMDGFKIFCDNMEHYNFEELIISSAILSAECYDILLDSLQTNNSIKSIKNEKETYLERNRLVKLYRILKSKKITEFWNWGELDLDYEEFKKVLQANYITKLTLQGRKNSTLYFDNIAEELKNTSITDLTVMTEPQVWNTFKDIIAENKSITRLNLSFNIQAEQFSSLNLGSNTRILDLTITRCSINLDKLLSKISQNTTLRRLALDVHSYRSIDPAGVHPLQTILTENKSLKELHLMHVQSISTIEALIEGLSTNKTLRKLVFHTHRFNYEIFSRLIEALKVNNTLVELSGVKIVDIGIYSAPINGKEADDFFLDLLKTNKTLRYIYGAEEYPYLEEKLQKNRQEQDQLINDTCFLIGMIVMKQPSFILPLEIWMHVFEYISFDFSDIDFVTYFRAVIRNKRK